MQQRIRRRAPRVSWLATVLAVGFGLAGVSSAVTLDYSTYLGGTGDDAEVAFSGLVSIAVDGAGNTYVAGTTASTDFPTTPGADRTSGGGLDIFVTKLSPAGAVLYSTYLGGQCDDVARGIAVDAAGNAYVTGRVNGGGTCFAGLKAGALVAKLDPNGNVVYQSVLGGSLADASIGRAIAVDAAGHAYITGVGWSNSNDFPTTPGAYRTDECANVIYLMGDAFVAKLDTDGSLVYSTFLCGTGDDSPTSIGIDAAGNAYVGGTTGSSDFPTVYPIVATRESGPVGLTGFVSELSADGSRLLFSTYLGGSKNDTVDGLAVDAAGNVYVTGEALSEDFPTTPGVLQEHAGNRFCIDICSDAFATKIDPRAHALVYSTYLFGELSDAGADIAVDGAGNAYVVGTTISSNFPIRAAFQSSMRSVPDAFVAKLSPDGTRLVYSSYIGGSHEGPSPRTGWDQGTGIAVDAAGQAYVAGYTQSYDFPTTPGAFQPNLAATTCDVFGTPCGDGFVAKITARGPGVVPPTNLTVAPAEVKPGGSVAATWAGIPRPTATDDLRLFTLGSLDSYPGRVIVWWPTTGAAAGTLSLILPDLEPGSYELRLTSPDPVYGLPSVVARSEPILVTLTPGATTTGGGGSGLADAGCAAACDDGDPCTDDTCVPGTGCVSTPAAGFASVTCTCARGGPGACAGQVPPAALGRRQERACSLFGDAAGTNGKPSQRRLRKGAAILGGSIGLVTKARKRGKIPNGCAVELEAELRDARDRAQGLLTTLGSRR